MQAGAPYVANLVLGEPSAAALPPGTGSSGPDSAPAQLTTQSSLNDPAADHPLDPAEQLHSATQAQPDQSNRNCAQRTVVRTLRQGAQRRLVQARRSLAVLLMHLRRHGHMAAGLLNLGYEAAYLLKRTPFFSPALHCSGLTIVRDDGSTTVRAATPNCAHALLGMT